MQARLDRHWLLAAALLLAGAVSATSCGDDVTEIVQPPGGPTTPTQLAPGEAPPGVVVEILGVSGGSGAGGFFLPGDPVSVRFSLTKDDGSPWQLSEMGFSSILVSGPTFRYQRVLAERNDVVQRALPQPDGSFVYAFPKLLPAAYLPPLNDSPDFGELDGELTGKPLLDGTYTVGLGLAWDYTVEGQPFQDVGEVTADFRLGGSALLAPRAVTSDALCNSCHVELQAHGGLRRTVTMCLLCHTAGAEDLNDPAVAAGTPGVSVFAGDLFHRLHNGRHLPSVAGIGVKPDGTLDYTVAPLPYQVVDGAGTIHDYSDVGFPAFPARTQPMPKDLGYKSLTPAAQAKDDVVRTGMSECAVCHGDPDGGGPLVAPSQGDLVFAQPSRAGCGSCHDDVLWEQDYVVNGQPMPPQLDDSGCIICHEASNGPLAVRDAHLHPLLDSLQNPGLSVELLSVGEAGAHNSSGTFEPGEGMAVRFELLDDSGAPVAPGALAEARALVWGPTFNGQTLLFVNLPTALLAGPPPFTVDLPERLQLERVGVATAALGDVFVTQRAPHLALQAAPTQVFVRTGTVAGGSVLAAAAERLQNFVDVADGSGFARDDFIAVDDGVSGAEEYLKIQLVDGDRLWFSSPFTPQYPPGLRLPHAAGALVRKVLLTTKTAGLDYQLAAATGTLTELVEFGAGNAVLCSYTSDFVVPAVHLAALNDAPELGEAEGEWIGKALVEGTYRVGISVHRRLTVQLQAEDNLYTLAAPPATLEVQFGVSSTPAPYDLIASGSVCNACHQDLAFHDDTWRGYETCLLCHGSAGAEDRPRYVAANAPATAGRSVSLRSMLHGIHMGRLHADPLAFEVVGAGNAPWPDNFSVHTWPHLLFPAQPGAASNCGKCHDGGAASWKLPAPRDHPTQQGVPVAVWREVCAACHDDSAALAHMALNTTPAGAETCGVCHGLDDLLSVENVHFPR